MSTAVLIGFFIAVIVFLYATQKILDKYKL